MTHKSVYRHDHCTTAALQHLPRQQPLRNSSVHTLNPTGISRDSLHKRRATGGKKKKYRKKRKYDDDCCSRRLHTLCTPRYEMGRQPAMTKLSSNVAVRRVRVRGGNSKFRALRLDTGNFSWGSEAITRKTRLLDVVYNASNNELVRVDGNCLVSSSTMMTVIANVLIAAPVHS